MAGTATRATRSTSVARVPAASPTSGFAIPTAGAGRATSCRSAAEPVRRAWATTATTRLGTTSRTGQEVTPQSVDHPWGDLWGACPCHWFMHRVFRDRNQSTRRRVEPIPVSHRRWRLRESNLVVGPWMQLGYVRGRSGERVPGCRYHLQPEQLIGHQQFGHRLWQLLSRRPKRQFHRPTTSQHRRLEDLRVQRQLDHQQDQSAGTMYSVMLVVEP